MSTQTPSALQGALRSPGAKFFVIGLIGFFLLIPASMVWMLVTERQDRAAGAQAEVAQSWGGAQTLGGVFISVPYETQQEMHTAKGVVIQQVRKTAIFLPEDITYKVGSRSDERKRGIFTVPVYDASVLVSGRFKRPAPGDIGSFTDADMRWSEAVLVMPVSDPRAIRAGAKVEIDGRSRTVEPGTGLPSRSAQKGIHIGKLFENTPSGFNFRLEFGLKGSTSFAVVPGARTTRVEIASDWAHPSFSGAYLPDNSTISADGFEAEWTVPHLALSMPLAFSAGMETSFGLNSDQSMGVRFYQPVDQYALVDRAIKYAVLFIGSVFVTVFVLESRSGRAVHGAQYALMGLALVLFYVLLLALAEHIGFMLAYGVAGLATTALVSTYCARLLASRWLGALIAGLLATVFGLLYLFLQMQDFALLAGAIFAFVVLAAVMFSTASLDWSGRGSASPVAAPSEKGTAVT
jgi:inner membrane protein